MLTPAGGSPLRLAVGPGLRDRRDLVNLKSFLQDDYIPQLLPSLRIKCRAFPRVPSLTRGLPGAESRVTATMEPRVVCVLVLVCVLTLSSLAQGELDTCVVAPHHRTNCGAPGITPDQCKARGCCFDNTVSGVPWCFQPVAVDNSPDEECFF
ncbi:trefoil factor 1 [Lontra canadensis]|uniref:trefoil factor 1 n=1 Tax=Lontra canadensis TaxID=76717 RepID=UPI0013F38B31|nr:trefoil factor 1 [Lontra canadensis]